MIGNEHFDQLLAAAPLANTWQASVDWQGVTTALSTESIDPSAVRAVAWCGFQEGGIDDASAEATFVMVHPAGVLCTSGKKKKRFGSAIKLHAIAFDGVRLHESVDVAPQPRERTGRFGITFTSADDTVQALTWTYPIKQFHDSGLEGAAAAADRDRLYEAIIEQLR